MNKAYIDGFKAGKAGLSDLVCPYARDTDPFWDWRTGWRAGQKSRD